MRRAGSGQESSNARYLWLVGFVTASAAFAGLSAAEASLLLSVCVSLMIGALSPLISRSTQPRDPVDPANMKAGSVVAGVIGTLAILVGVLFRALG
jgi:hypothetical protein